MTAGTSRPQPQRPNHHTTLASRPTPPAQSLDVCHSHGSCPSPLPSEHTQAWHRMRARRDQAARLFGGHLLRFLEERHVQSLRANLFPGEDGKDAVRCVRRWLLLPSRLHLQDSDRVRPGHLRTHWHGGVGQHVQSALARSRPRGRPPLQRPAPWPRAALARGAPSPRGCRREAALWLAS